MLENKKQETAEIEKHNFKILIDYAQKTNSKKSEKEIRNIALGIKFKLPNNFKEQYEQTKEEFPQLKENFLENQPIVQKQALTPIYMFNKHKDNVKLQAQLPYKSFLKNEKKKNGIVNIKRIGKMLENVSNQELQGAGLSPIKKLVILGILDYAQRRP